MYLLSANIKFSRLTLFNISFFKKYIKLYYFDLFNKPYFTILISKINKYLFNLRPKLSCFFLPPRKTHITVIRSPHVFKKSKEKYLFYSYSLIVSYQIPSDISYFFFRHNNVFFFKSLYYWFYNSLSINFFVKYSKSLII